MARAVLVAGVSFTKMNSSLKAIVKLLVEQYKSLDIIYFGDEARYAGTITRVKQKPPLVPIDCGSSHDLAAGLTAASMMSAEVVVVLTHGNTKKANEALYLVAKNSGTAPIFYFEGVQKTQLETDLRSLTEVCRKLPELKEALDRLAPQNEPRGPLRYKTLLISPAARNRNAEQVVGVSQNRLIAAGRQPWRNIRIVSVWHYMLDNVEKIEDAELVIAVSNFAYGASGITAIKKVIAQCRTTKFIIIGVNETGKDEWLVELEGLAEGRVTVIPAEHRAATAQILDYALSS